MKVKQCISVVALLIGGIASLYYKQNELAGVCFGAIASWGLINGVNGVRK